MYIFPGSSYADPQRDGKAEMVIKEERTQIQVETKEETKSEEHGTITDKPGYTIFNFQVQKRKQQLKQTA